jgi:hypothetical protein
MNRKMIPLTVYIAGPMTGLPDSNYPAFHAAEKALAQEGFVVLNPARNESDDWTGYMRMSINQVARADVMYVLRGWRNSKGAALEHKIAEELGLVIRYESDLAPTGMMQTVCDTDAETTVMKAYGASIADLGKEMLKNPLMSVVPYAELNRLLQYVEHQRPERVPSAIGDAARALRKVTPP